MMARWPPLTVQRDSDFYRQRIARETRARERDRPEVPLVSPFPMSARRETRPFGAIPAAELIRPMSLQRPPTITVMHTKLPPRTAVHQQAVNELGVMRGPWHEPPLVMAGGSQAAAFNEPPRAFGRYLEVSTMSVHNPASPVVPWKTTFPA